MPCCTTTHFRVINHSSDRPMMMYCVNTSSWQHWWCINARDPKSRSLQNLVFTHSQGRIGRWQNWERKRPTWWLWLPITFLTSCEPQVESSHSWALVSPISDWLCDGATLGAVAFPDTGQHQQLLAEPGWVLSCETQAPAFADNSRFSSK